MTTPALPSVAVLNADQLRELVADAVSTALAEFDGGRAPEPDLVTPTVMARYHPPSVLTWLEHNGGRG